MTTLNLPKYIFRTKTEDGKHFIYDDWRKRYVSLTPEEWVRQHFARFLVQEKGFPAGRMGNEISLVQNGRKRRCDTVVYDKTGRPFVIVEYKVHVVFVSPIAGKQSSVEECCGLAGIETASVEIINIKTDTESLVGIDGKVGFETLFTVTAIESFIIAQVGKGRKRIGKYDIFRA